MNVVREITQINQKELELGISEEASWHAKYKNSAYIYCSGLDYDLTEGDIICVFSQFGEMVDCNLLYDKKTGKSRGGCFIAFENQKSTVLAVDNMNGAKLQNRTLRVDHVLNYRKPKQKEKKESAAENPLDGVEEEDDEYETRRKKIWDYELYQTQVPFGEPEKTSTQDAQPSSESQTTQKSRIMEILAKRKTEYEAKRKADELGTAYKPPGQKSGAWAPPQQGSTKQYDRRKTRTSRSRSRSPKRKDRAEESRSHSRERNRRKDRSGSKEHHRHGSRERNRK